MAARDVVSWKMMVSGYTSAGMWGKAFELLQRVPGANVATWNAVAAGNYDEVIRLLSHMRNCHETGVAEPTKVRSLMSTLGLVEQYGFLYFVKSCCTL